MLLARLGPHACAAGAQASLVLTAQMVDDCGVNSVVLVLAVAYSGCQVEGEI
jgi:hypothetical protein